MERDNSFDFFLFREFGGSTGQTRTDNSEIKDNKKTVRDDKITRAHLQKKREKTKEVVDVSSATSG